MLLLKYASCEGPSPWRSWICPHRRVSLPHPWARPQTLSGVSSRVARAFSAGARLVLVDPVHTGVQARGRWSTATGLAFSTGAPISEGAALSDAYYAMRRTALTIETVGAVLVDAGSSHGLSADPAEHLVGGRSSPAGTVAFLCGRGESASTAELTLARDAARIVVGDIPIPRKSVAVLPIDWQLSDSRLLSTSMEPILHTVVAGRELLILQAADGGEVLLSPVFRVRHRRGPVFVERTPQGIIVHFDAARLASVVLDGDQGPLQLLALEPALAKRAWPLDDLWRTTPAHPAASNAGDDRPARGVVIGADFAAPEADGGFRLQVSKKGFGVSLGPVARRRSTHLVGAALVVRTEVACCAHSRLDVARRCA